MDHTEHLSHRPLDWEHAAEWEIVNALLDRPSPMDPRFYNWVARHRPQCIGRANELHAAMGGMVFRVRG